MNKTKNEEQIMWDISKKIIIALSITLAVIATFCFLLLGLLLAFTVNDTARELREDNCVEWCKR